MYEIYGLALSADANDKQQLLFTVTILDDDPLFREALRDYLQSMKIENIECYASGEEFLAIMQETDKRLVVSDFDFGAPQLMNGLQVLEAIKQRNAATPVIILSAQDKISIALQVLKGGAVDYYMKGTESTFTAVLTSILKINELQRLRKNEKDYIATIVFGSAVAIIIIGVLMYMNFA